MTDQNDSTRRITAKAHPNIALVKYWGKVDTERNIPATGSLSLTLDTLATTTVVQHAERDTLTLNDAPAPREASRLFTFLDRTFPGRPSIAVASENNFPTAAGLASSASGFAALTLAVDALLGTGHDTHRLAQIAGSGSGSAARSLYGGIVRLDTPQASGDDIHLTQIAEAADWPLEVIVAVVNDGPKAVGSTEGMERTRLTSPYYGAWLEHHAADLDRATEAVGKKDFDALAVVTEHSFMKMHALMLSAQPALLYWLPASLEVVRHVQHLRGQGWPVCCTMDAGPQVKIVTLADDAVRVQFEVESLPGVRSTIRAPLGQGAERLA